MQGSELALWRRWRERRDRRAFAQVVEAHTGFAFDFARRVTGHAADAEDVAQQALLELTRIGAEVPERVGLRAFLGRRIVLAARTLRRSALTRRRLDARATPPQPRDAIADVEARDQVRAALAMLDEADRDAVVLRYLHGLAYGEIAHVLGVREEAARMRVHRALRRLRRGLGPRPDRALASLALFVPPAGFLRSTVEVASLMGGVVVMGITVRKVVAVAGLLVLLAVGGYVLRAALRAPPPDRARVVATRHRAVVAPPPAPAAAPDDPPPATDPVAPAGATALTGTLRYTDGAPVRGVLQLDGAFLDSGGGTPTDAAGRFRLADVEAGDRVLYLKTTSGHVQIGSAVVTADAVRELVLELDRGAVLAGTVLDGETPLEGAFLMLSRAGGHAANEQGRSAFGSTGDDGGFRFDHLPPGTYEVQVQCAGYERALHRVELAADSAPVRIRLARTEPLGIRLSNVPAALDGVTAMLYVKPELPGLGARGVPAVLREGEVVTLERPAPGRCRLSLLLPYALGEAIVDVALDAGPATPAVIVMRLPVGGRLRGEVLGPDGRGLPQRTVVLDPGLYETTTDRDGAFAFGYVKPGRYRAFVRSGSGRLPTVSFDIAAGATATPRIRLSGNGTIRGTVAPAPTRGTAAAVFRTGGRVAGTAVVDVHGAFALADLAPGEYEIAVRAGSTRIPPGRVTLFADTEVDAGVFFAGVPPRVPVVVRVPAGIALPRSIAVTVVLPARTLHDTAVLDAGGKGVLTKLQPGTYVLRAEAPGFAAAEFEIAIPAATPVELHLAPE